MQNSLFRYGLEACPNVVLISENATGKVTFANARAKKWLVPNEPSNYFLSNKIHLRFQEFAPDCKPAERSSCSDENDVVPDGTKHAAFFTIELRTQSNTTRVALDEQDILKDQTVLERTVSPSQSKEEQPNVLKSRCKIRLLNLPQNFGGGTHHPTQNEEPNGLTADRKSSKPQKQRDKKIIINHATDEWLNGTLWKTSTHTMLIVHIDYMQKRGTRLHLDPLTGLPDRAFVLAKLTDAWQADSEGRHPFALLFIDLNNFKPVNDKWGHPIGDILLEKVAKRMENCLRGEDMIGRYGGDEFIAILTKIHKHIDAEHVAKRIEASLCKPINVEGNTFSLTAGIGIALSNEGFVSQAEMLKKADKRMYAAKRQNK